MVVSFGIPPDTSFLLEDVTEQELNLQATENNIELQLSKMTGDDILLEFEALSYDWDDDDA